MTDPFPVLKSEATSQYQLQTIILMRITVVLLEQTMSWVENLPHNLSLKK